MSEKKKKMPQVGTQVFLVPADVMDEKTKKPTGKVFVVRDPLSKIPLPKDGTTKTINTYWRRRLQDGDVYISTPPKAPKAESKS